jgi:hypothetical protein
MYSSAMKRVNLMSSFRTMAFSSSSVYSFDRDPTRLTGLTSSFSESSSLDDSSWSRPLREVCFSEELRILRSSAVSPPPRSADTDSASESSASLSGVACVGAGVSRCEEEDMVSPRVGQVEDIARATATMWTGGCHVHQRKMQVTDIMCG